MADLEELPALVPTFLWSSPAGIHIRFFDEWLRSGLIAPRSDVQERARWAAEPTAQAVCQMFCDGGQDPCAIISAKIFIYNKSRDVDRVCPACFRWYRVGEGPKSYSGLEEFFARPVQAEPEVEQDVVAEQELSGICTRDCMKNSNAGSDAVLGKTADQLTAEEVATMNNNPQSAYTVRKPTETERAQGAELTFMRRPPPESPPGSPLPELG
ncbi:hypothetical protein Egran_00053 [Elaphomyces granulatus]|uniref:Uncharacterized protein n=1 Tax=Elaphomyces granulatus TaxID=519963 RepID=A0A232M731_9EURO|nr:hypothetical protein Egran_00053 [Elaphomyces granulatus]